MWPPELTTPNGSFGQVEFEEFYEWVMPRQAFPAIPDTPEDWNERLDLVHARGRAHSCIRHDRKGSTVVSDDDVHRKYTIGKKLGEGKFASVHLCTDMVSSCS